MAQLREEVELKKLAQDSKLTMAFLLGLSGLEFIVFFKQSYFILRPMVYQADLICFLLELI